MVARFYLDQSQLDDANVGLDGPSPAFVLDTSTLDVGVLDGTTFTTPATGAASLGSITATAIGTVTHIVNGVAVAALGELIAEVTEVTVTVDGVADAPLGSLTASGSATVIHAASADSVLGGLSASATANIDNPASGDAPLGGLTASATGDVSVVASAQAELGAMTSSATGSVSVIATAVGNLGSVAAAAIGTVIPLGTMTANLGGLDAVALGTVTPVTPTVQPGGAPYPYRRQKSRKKAEPVVEVLEPETVLVVVKTVEAYCTPIVASVSAYAEGAVTFVAEDDDLQVLLML